MYRNLKHNGLFLLESHPEWWSHMLMRYPTLGCAWGRLDGSQSHYLLRIPNARKQSLLS